MYWIIIAACSEGVDGKCLMMRDPEPHRTYAECVAVLQPVMESKALESRLRVELQSDGALRVTGLCADEEQRDILIEGIETESTEGLVRVDG